MLLFLDLAYDEAKAKGRLRSMADLHEAIVHGAVKRLRPKMMTVTAAMIGPHADHVVDRHRRRRDEAGGRAHGRRPGHVLPAGAARLPGDLPALALAHRGPAHAAAQPPEVASWRRTTRFTLLLLGAVAGAAALAAKTVFDRGLGAHAEPWAVEEWVARGARHLATPRGERERRNPLPASTEVLAAGRAHFADHCAVCHANDGGGKTTFGAAMYPRTPDLRRAASQAPSDGEMFSVIRNGTRFTGMPAFWKGRRKKTRRPGTSCISYVIPRASPPKRSWRCRTSIQRAARRSGRRRRSAASSREKRRSGRRQPSAAAGDDVVMDLVIPRRTQPSRATRIYRDGTTFKGGRMNCRATVAWFG